MMKPVKLSSLSAEFLARPKDSPGKIRRDAANEKRVCSRVDYFRIDLLPAPTGEIWERGQGKSKRPGGIIYRGFHLGNELTQYVEYFCSTF